MSSRDALGRQLFPLGAIHITPGAETAALATGSPQEIAKLFRRHCTGDWGDLDEYDIAVNNAAARTDERVLSAYVLSTGVKVWIITEADRRSTTLLLPEEY